MSEQRAPATTANVVLRSQTTGESEEAERVLSRFAAGLREGLKPERAAAVAGAACLLTVDDDMEARAARYNRWYARAHPMPLRADGEAYRHRQLARRRRRTT
jgi:hypothetical protein